MSLPKHARSTTLKAHPMATEIDNTMVRARLGAPYEDDGNCELCNAGGPTWIVASSAEDAEEGETLPFCAECILRADK